MHILKLLAELSNVLSDDFRAYLPELLPKFIALFSEAERSSQYTAVFPALSTLEVRCPLMALMNPPPYRAAVIPLIYFDLIALMNGPAPHPSHHDTGGGYECRQLRTCHIGIVLSGAAHQCLGPTCILLCSARSCGPGRACCCCAPAPQALGPAVEEHLHLVLPALVNLICPRISSTPFDVRRTALQSMR